MLCLGASKPRITSGDDVTLMRRRGTVPPTTSRPLSSVPTVVWGVAPTTMYEHGKSFRRSAYTSVCACACSRKSRVHVESQNITLVHGIDTCAHIKPTSSNDERHQSLHPHSAATPTAASTTITHTSFPSSLPSARHTPATAVFENCDAISVGAVYRRAAYSSIFN